MTRAPFPFRRALLISCLALAAIPASAREIVTNNVRIAVAPSWLTESKVQAVTDRIQSILEWDIHRVNVFFDGPDAFRAAGANNPLIEALFRHADGTVHLGPTVTADNFAAVFGHELVHVVFHQKYKGAIPAWLEEGFANYYAKKGKVDYAWLAKQPFRDLTTLTHPFRGDDDPGYDYAASTAAVELIATRCSLPDLLQLSVGKRLETYLKTYCEIPDVNAAFRDWVGRRARELAGKKR